MLKLTFDGMTLIQIGPPDALGSPKSGSLPAESCANTLDTKGAALSEITTKNASVRTAAQGKQGDLLHDHTAVGSS